MSKFLEEFDIEEKPFSYLAEQYSNLTIMNKIVQRVDPERQVFLNDDESIDWIEIDLDYRLYRSNRNSIRLSMHLYGCKTESKVRTNLC